MAGWPGCQMRCGSQFDYNDMDPIYHKTLPCSTIVETYSMDSVTYDILYNILIK